MVLYTRYKYSMFNTSVQDTGTIFNDPEYEGADEMARGATYGALASGSLVGMSQHEGSLSEQAERNARKVWQFEVV